MENNISIADSHMLRAGPEDLEKYENGLGLVPIEGEEPSIFSLFALIYIIFPFRRKRPSKTE
ncbi:MAG: hypothetical protein LIO93_10755 [Bacteroidales bacterium]|nr:hypothetical protein [Bacteroidales bacterium]